MKEEHVIVEADAGIRLDRWFKRHRPGITHGALEKALRKGLVRLDGRKAEASTRTQAGQRLSVAESVAVGQSSAPMKPRRMPNASLLKDIRRTVIYEDAQMLILNKPAGLAVQGGSGQKEHIDGLLPFLGEELKLVHRLDKDTSGVLVLAKGAKSAARLAKLFAGKEIEKTYVALVAGVPKKPEGRIDMSLMKEARGAESGMRAFEKVGASDKGLRAVTEYRVLSAYGKKLAWMELKPITGRTHQLRVHMAEIGCPIVGDAKYGGGVAFIDHLGMNDLGLPDTLHLHAERIRLPGDNSGVIEVKAPWPPHMKESKRILG